MAKKQSLIDEYELDDIDDDVALITKISDFGELSKADENILRENISIMNKKINLQLEGEKLIMAQNVFADLVDDIQRTSSSELKNRIFDNMKTGMDYKFYMEATEKKWKMLQNLLRVDSQNSSGSPAQIKLGLRYADDKGNTTSIMVAVNGE